MRSARPRRPVWVESEPFTRYYYYVRPDNRFQASGFSYIGQDLSVPKIIIPLRLGNKPHRRSRQAEDKSPTEDTPAFV